MEYWSAGVLRQVRIAPRVRGVGGAEGAVDNSLRWFGWVSGYAIPGLTPPHSARPDSRTRTTTRRKRLGRRVVVWACSWGQNPRLSPVIPSGLDRYRPNPKQTNRLHFAVLGYRVEVVITRCAINPAHQHRSHSTMRHWACVPAVRSWSKR
jgi:hypothetical protein